MKGESSRQRTGGVTNPSELTPRSYDCAMDDLSRSDFKRLVNNMSRAFRDSHGGGLVERFESVSKLLFVKIVDERLVAGTWPGVPRATQPAMQWRPGDV